MNLSILFSFVVVLTCLFSESYATELSKLEVCKAIKKEKQHVAYLLNHDCSIAKGPIDYGKWIDDGKSEEVLLPTTYKMLIYPARTNIINNDCFQYGCLKLIKSKQVCEGAATYDVQVRLIFRRKEKKYYQYEDNTEFVQLIIDDPDDNYPSELIYRFIPRIKGYICKP